MTRLKLFLYRVFHFTHPLARFRKTIQEILRLLVEMLEYLELRTKTICFSFLFFPSLFRSSNLWNVLFRWKQKNISTVCQSSIYSIGTK